MPLHDTSGVSHECSNHEHGPLQLSRDATIDLTVSRQAAHTRISRPGVLIWQTAVSTITVAAFAPLHTTFVITAGPTHAGQHEQVLKQGH